MVIRVCIDETYSHQTRGDAPLMVSGCVSSTLKWDRFDTRWRKLLAQYGLQRIHFDEIWNRRGEFANIPNAKLVEIVEKFEKTIFANVHFGFSTVLYRDDFERYRDTKGTALHSILDSDYGVSIRVCYGFLDSFVPDLMCLNGTPIDVIVEGGHANEGAVNEIFREYSRVNSGARGAIQQVRVVRKDDCFGTQAADMRGGIYLIEERSGKHDYADMPPDLKSATEFVKGGKLRWFRLPINIGVLTHLRDSIILSRPKFRHLYGHLVSTTS